MSIEAEVLTCDSSEKEILKLDFCSVITHDYDGPLKLDLKRLEEIGCFNDLPSKDRFTNNEIDMFDREAKWIAKMLLYVPGAKKIFPEETELENTIKNLLEKLLDEKLCVVLTNPASKHPAF